MGSGIFSQFSFGVENNWGEKAIANHLLEAKDGSGINTNLDNQVAEAFNGQMAKNVDVFPGLRKDEGELSMYLVSDVAPYFLINLLGKVASEAYNPGEGVVSGVYQHLISESADRPSMTVEQIIGDLKNVCTGFQTNEAEISINVGEAVGLNFKGFAKDAQSLEVPSTPVASTHRLMHSSDNIVFKVDDIPFSGVTSFKLTYKNNTNPEHDITHGNKVAMRGVGKTEYEGEIEIMLDSSNATTEYEKYLNNTMRKINISVTGDQIDETGVSEKIEIDLAKVNFKEMETPATFETVKTKIKFIGVLDKVTGKHIDIKVINDVASFAN